MARPIAFDLRDRVVLVTGGARGIGLDAGRRLAARGAQVAVLDVDGDAAARAASAIGERAADFAVDVTDRDALAAAVEAVLARFGQIDAVVANAGVAPPTGTILGVDAGAWERVVEVNLHGVYRTVKATLPHVVARRGHVLVIASVYAMSNGAMASPYAVSKAAVEALGRALRVELAPYGATAGVAYFGFIDTQLVRDAYADPVAAQLRTLLPKWIAKPLPVGRAGAAIVRGLERRAARVMVPRYVPALAAVRGLLPVTVDLQLARDARVHRAIGECDARAVPPPPAAPAAAPSISREA